MCSLFQDRISDVLILLLPERAFRHPLPSLPGKQDVLLLAEPLLPPLTPVARAPLEPGQQLSCPACACVSEPGWWIAAEMPLSQRCRGHEGCCLPWLGIVQGRRSMSWCRGGTPRAWKGGSEEPRVKLLGGNLCRLRGWRGHRNQA